MATITAFQPFNQTTDAAIQTIFSDPLDYSLQGNVITHATYLATNGETITLSGQVVGTDYFNATGTITGYSESNVNGVKYSISDISVDWQQYIYFTETTGDSIGLQSTVFQGNDTFYGSNGSDFMMAFNGNDTLYGGGAIDAAQDGNDILLGNAGSDRIFGNGGDDILLGGSTLFDATDAADTIYGGLGNDTIYAGGGSDLVFGNNGNDLIAMTSGNDLVLGGSGNDIFVFMNSTTGYHTIVDFQQGDKLSIQGKDFSTLLNSAVSDANGTFIRLDADSGITLAGVSTTDLDINDFYFW